MNIHPVASALTAASLRRSGTLGHQTTPISEGICFSIFLAKAMPEIETRPC